MQSNPRIAIVGGGPGGLALARILAVHGIGAAVFELDADPQARPQGGSLDLHVESGQLALRRAGLEADFERIARYGDQEVRLFDKHGTLLYEDADSASGDRPEVDRTALRALLIDSLPPGTIRWGHKVRAVAASDDGRYTIVSEPRCQERFDLVVGADGAWSRVRPLVSAAQPAYSGVTFVELEIDDIDAREPELARMVGHGKIFALCEAKGIIAQRNDHSHVRVYVAFRASETWVTGALDLSDPARARRDLLRQFDGWAPALTDFIVRAGDRMVARPIVALPIGHRWAERPGITLLGDAAHVMSPFSGEGVNIAMLDAAELAQRLATAGASWPAAVRAYEEAMFARAAEAAAGAAMGMEAAMSDAAPRSMLELLQSQAAPA
jgi:2-polyprenyl-6-methoxyphenol hydroxylase-like FAD-dependent oxidoreductase